MLPPAQAQPKCRPRVFWIWLSRTWSGWREALIIVKPATVVGWHRKGFKLYWTKLSQHRVGGRPVVSLQVRILIRQMATTNPLWGAPRIHGELLKLGINISERSVSGLLLRPRRPPSQTRRAFLTNHLNQIASIDLFTVPTATFRVLFCLVVVTKNWIRAAGLTANGSIHHGGLLDHHRTLPRVK